MARKFVSVLDFLNFGLFILLLITCWFRSQIDVSTWMPSVGRFHLLILHLPIGAMVFYSLWHFMLKGDRSDDQSNLKDRALFQTVLLTSLLASLTGLFHSLGGDFPVKALDNHMYGALVFTTGLFVCQYFLQSSFGSVGIISALAALVYTGHVGGSLTHGEDFLWPKPKENIDTTSISQNDQSVYTALIQPILETKCVSCHSLTKIKGGLQLIDFTSIMKGGEHGIVIKPFSAIESKIYNYAMLPLKDEMHMPPDGKVQLTSDEILILKHWIQGGASFSKKMSSNNKQDSLYTFVEKINAQRLTAKNDKTYDFASASPDLITSLSNPYLHISQISADKPALSARFFVAQHFDINNLRKAQKLKTQLTQIDLANMPFYDKDLELLLPFSNLDQLVFNGTQVTSVALCKLSALVKLEKLSLSNTSIDAKLESCLASFKSLRHIYLNDTKISAETIKLWQRKYPKIKFYYLDKLNDKIALVSPQVKNKNRILLSGEKVELICDIKGSQIRYSLDGQEPDSVTSTVYAKPFVFNQTTRLRSITVKDGWLKSPETDVTFFISGIKPKSIKLVNPPDVKYPGSGVLTFSNDMLGPLENLQDNNWIAFRDKKFIGTFTFEKPMQRIKSVYFAFGRQIGQYVFPPAELRLYGIDTNGKSTLLGKVKPPQIEANYKMGSKSDHVVIDIEKPVAYAAYRLEGDNLPIIPAWHPGKGEKGWLFIDEIFWYE